MIKLSDDKTRFQLDFLTKLHAELNNRLTKGESDITIKYLNDAPGIVNTQSKNYLTDDVTGYWDNFLDTFRSVVLRNFFYKKLTIL